MSIILPIEIRQISIFNSRIYVYVAVERAGNSVLLPVYEDTASLFIILILIASYSMYRRDVANCTSYIRLVKFYDSPTMKTTVSATGALTDKRVQQSRSQALEGLTARQRTIDMFARINAVYLSPTLIYYAIVFNYDNNTSSI